MQILLDAISAKLPPGEESRRLFHGRGRACPGYEDLLIDWYAPVLLLTLYAQRDSCWLAEVVSRLRSLVPHCRAIIVQERFLRNSPSRVLWGELPDQVDAVESGARYRLRLGQGQNVGFFLDMAEGRQLVRSLAEGKRILNLFAYSCSFSVAALLGGAAQVVNLDMNKGALALGRENHLLNGLDCRRASFLPLELFRSIGKLRKLGPFDLVICDPPAAQGESFTAERDWPRLLRRLPELLTETGDIIACLNAPHLPPRYLQQLFARQLPAAVMQQQLASGADFPDADPDMGLNILHYRLSKN